MTGAANVRWLAGLSLPLVATVLFALQSKTSANSNEYTDSRQCATCHVAIAAKYARTGMARSFYKSAVPGETRFFHEPSQTWYSMQSRGGETFQKRWRIGFDGKEAEVRESRVDYVMGSGNHVRTFLHRTDRGALVELPLAWYSEKGGSWAMNPGHDLPYTLPPRTVAYECMFCHNAYPGIPAGHEEPGSEALYTGTLPEGIDCQRCHGPGGDHVRAAQQPGTKSEDIRHAILNPARLSRDRQMEVCMQCHLETTSLQLPHSIEKFGRGPFSYNPAEPLSSFILFFDHAPAGRYKDDFEIAHSAYRLRKSKCFLESQMTCLTCHDPHDVPRGEQAKLHYNGVCAQCHKTLAPSHPAAPDCVACHMPKRRTQDVVHALMTDHFIQRTPPPGDLTAMIAEWHETPLQEYRGPVVPYYPRTLAPQDAVYRAVAQVTQKSNLNAGLPSLQNLVAQQKTLPPQVYIELGQAWLNARNARNAVSAFEQAVKREPDSPVALLNLADALTEAGQPARAEQVLKHAVQTSPEDPLLWYQFGLTTLSAAHEEEALHAFQRAADLDPNMAEAQNMLGSSFARRARIDDAEKAFRNALIINPDFAEAQGNLAHLLAARGDLNQAQYYFARSVLLKADDAEVHVNYAVTLAGLNRFSEAEAQARAAVKTDPKSADAHNFLGTLLAHALRPDPALREFLEAVRLRPGFGLAHLNAADLLAAKGDRAAARTHLQQAARDEDRNVRQKAEDKLHQLR